VASGAVVLNGLALQTGDGARIEAESVLVIQAETPAEVLLFELA